MSSEKAWGNMVVQCIIVIGSERGDGFRTIIF